MQVHTLDKADIVNELTIGSQISHAVQSGHRADFSLLLSMFSDDIRENTPVEVITKQKPTNDLLRAQFDLPSPQPLISNQSTYKESAIQSEAFQKGGLSSAKLNHYLKPEPLVYQLEDTGNLPEDVYHNLSGHQRRKLMSKATEDVLPFDLYEQLLVSYRKDQLDVRC